MSPIYPLSTQGGHLGRAPPNGKAGATVKVSTNDGVSKSKLVHAVQESLVKRPLSCTVGDRVSRGNSVNPTL